MTLPNRKWNGEDTHCRTVVELDKAAGRSRVLLIASDERDRTLMHKHKKIGVFLAPPFGLYRMKAYLESRGLADVDVFDPNLYPEGIERIIARMLDRRQYDIIGFSVTHINLQSDMVMIANVNDYTNSSYDKKPLLVAGGQEITGNYAQWLENSPLDMAIIGYGEAVLESIIRIMRDYPEGPLGRFSNVRGLVYYHNEEPHVQFAEHISNDRFREITFSYDPTNEIPYEEYWKRNSALFSPKDLRARGATLRCVRLFTSSHCTNACGFCSSSPFLKHATGKHTPVYRLTAEEVVELVIRNIKLHNPDAIFFNDDDFVIGDKDGIKRVMEFSRLIKEAKKQGLIPEKLRLYIQTKARSITKRTTEGQYIPNRPLLDAMKQSGVVLVGVGVEAFSNHLLKSPSINKKMPSEMADAAIIGLFESGIVPLINLIFLPPETTKDDILITVDKTIGYVERGAKVIMQPLIEVFPGAPISAPAVLKQLVHETMEVEVASGAKIKIETYILPQDEEIRQWAKHIEVEGDRVVEELSNDPENGFKYPPQHIRALTYFIPMLRRMGFTERVDSIYEVISDLAKVYEMTSEQNADAFSERLMEIRAVSLREKRRVQDALEVIGHEGSCRDIEYLIMMYEGIFFYDGELSKWAQTQSAAVLRAISGIIIRFAQLDDFRFDPQLVEYIRRFSKALPRSRSLQEARQLSATLNRELKIDDAIIESSIDIILAKLDEVSDTQEKTLRLYTLDENVFYETRRDFGVIGPTASQEVCDLLAGLNAISIVIDAKGVEKVEHIRSQVRSLIEAIGVTDTAALLDVVSESSDNVFRIEVFSDEERSRLHQEIKSSTWRRVVAERLKHNNRVFVGTHQMHYYYYLGTFQKMSESDIFVLMDDLQYVRREWQNRQRFGDKQEWLTIPLYRGHRKDKIGAKRIANVTNWKRQHMGQLKRLLSQQPFYREHAVFLEELYSRSWKTLSALSEATTRYVAKRFCLHDVFLVRASAAGAIPDGYRKGRYITETVKRFARDFMTKPSCQVVHISGQGADYLNEPDEEGILNRDRLLSKGIGVKISAYDPDFARGRWGINPYSSGLEVLCQLGSQAGADIMRCFRSLRSDENQNENQRMNERVETEAVEGVGG